MKTDSTRKNHKFIGLLSIGTFLEYFDLLLYVHMAVVLNSLFFPKTDAFTTKLLSSFAFCTTFAFRPIGALIFGYIGDKISRKSTITITTTLMAGCCLTMGFLPTYDEWGIKASIIMIVCRAVQGISSMGEIVGAKLYATENLRKKASYLGAGIIDISRALGAVAALLWCTIVTSEGLNWRYAFYAGACIAFIGTVARSRLRETPEFIKAIEHQKIEKERCDTNVIKSYFDAKKANLVSKKNSSIENTKELQDITNEINKKTILAYFAISTGGGLVAYLIYVYCTDLLHLDFKLSHNNIFKNNLLIAIIDIVYISFVVALSQKFSPIKILKNISIIFSINLFFVVYLLANASSPMHIFIAQLLLCCSLMETPASPILYRHFPVLKRFTAISFLFSLAKIFGYVVSTFVLMFFYRICGHYGLLFVLVPIAISFYWAVCHFEKLENISDKIEKEQNQELRRNTPGTTEYEEDLRKAQEIAKEIFS